MTIQTYLHTIIPPSIVCKLCKNSIAEIFQESGDYCLLLAGDNMS